MKKNFSIMFCLLMLLSVMSGCGRSTVNDVRPGDTDTNRPGVNDSVVAPNNGMVDDNGILQPEITDHPVTDKIENGVENAGDAVQRGMDRMGNAAKNAVDDMTNR